MTVFDMTCVMNVMDATQRCKNTTLYFNTLIHFMTVMPSRILMKLSLAWLTDVSPLTEPTDNANVSIVKYKGDYYVSTETNFMHRVDPETLETTGKVF